MRKFHRAGLALLITGLIGGHALSQSGLLDRDAQRLARARDTHLAEIERAFDAYAARVDRANTALIRNYEQVMRPYESRGETAVVESLQRDLDELVRRSLTMAFPSPPSTGDDDKRSPQAFQKLLEAIGPTVVHASGRRAQSANATEYDHVVLYFTASWCGPCRRFTPELIQFYNANRSVGRWDILVVSGDRTEDAFENYVRSANMPWYVVPFDRSDAMHELFPGGYPRVLAIDREGRTVYRSRLAQQTYEEMFQELTTVLRR